LFPYKESLYAWRAGSYRKRNNQKTRHCSGIFF
jgi:hypothetical protein